MRTINDVHQQFAEYFSVPDLKPYLYFLSKRMSEGHICINVDDINVEEIPEQYASVTDSRMLAQQAIIGDAQHDNHPFILHNDMLYMQRYFRYENMLLNRLYNFFEQEKIEIAKRSEALIALKPFVDKLFTNAGNQGADWQLAAAITAVLHNFTIITGGPGTGKTTTVAKILALSFTLQPDIKVALAAPTGKAGARMAESLMNANLDVDDSITQKFANLKPATIHRLLGWQKDSPYFRHHAANPLVADLVIVDEASMIDVALFAKLLDAIAQGARIILLGDKDQLASVEAGSLFGDLCRAQNSLNKFTSERAQYINQFVAQDAAELGDEYTDNQNHPLFQHIVELRYSHRFKGDEGIGKISRAVINNDSVVLSQFIDQPNDSTVTIDQEYSAAIFENFIDGYKQYIQEPDILTALHKLNQLRLLCAVKVGNQGVYSANAAVELHLASKGYIVRDSIFYNNRPIMVTQNNYTLGLYNGDVGILRPDENGVMKAWFIDSSESDGHKLKSVLPGFITQMETVFAMTIHKSQGSEFESVMVILPNSPNRLLTRELLYTGITRAKKQVIIQTTKDVLMATAAAQVERGSGVIARLNTSDKNQNN